MRKVAVICLAGLIGSYAMDFSELDKELAKHKKENMLREIRIERKTGRLKEKEVDREVKRSRIYDEVFMIESYKGLLSAKTVQIRSNGYVGKVLITDNVAIYTGMETPYGEVNVGNMKIGSLWIDINGIVKQAGVQAPTIPATGGQGIGAILPPPAPPPPPPPPAPKKEATPPSQPQEPGAQGQTPPQEQSLPPQPPPRSQ